MKLTQSTIAKLTSTKADEIFFDDDLPRFGVRLREGGSRKYVVQIQAGRNCPSLYYRPNSNDDAGRSPQTRQKGIGRG